MSIVEEKDRLSLEIESSLEAIEEADRRVISFLTARGDPIDLFAVRILLREAVMNAVVHGGGEETTGCGTLDVRVDAEGVTIRVSDNGPGFVHDRLPNTREVLSDGGRGIPLMKLYSDVMEFNDKGNEVTLRKLFRSDDSGLVEDDKK